MRARTDDLTGLLNHGTFKDWLGRSVVARDPFGLVMIDLDEFKTVNDSLGHQAGDRLLREIADAILAAARETDAVFRYGGDEFVVILPRTDAEGLMAAAERILQAAESVGGKGSAWHAEGVRVGASIGTAFFPDDGETPEDVLLAADRACFVAKRRGRGHVATASEGLAHRERVRAVRADPGRSADRRGGLTGAPRPPSPPFRDARHNRAHGEEWPCTRHIVTGFGIAIARSSGSRSSRASPWCSPGACRRPCRGRPIRRRRRRGPRRRPIPPPRPTPPPPTPTPAPTFVIYKVKSGDTLTSIAKEFKTDGRSIAYWSRERHPSLDPESSKYSPDRLKVGWTLEIMPGQTYVPPEDDGESGELYTPVPDDLDPEEPEESRRRVGVRPDGSRERSGGRTYPRPMAVARGSAPRIVVIGQVASEAP